MSNRHRLSREQRKEVAFFQKYIHDHERAWPAEVHFLPKLPKGTEMKTKWLNLRDRGAYRAVYFDPSRNRYENRYEGGREYKSLGRYGYRLEIHPTRDGRGTTMKYCKIDFCLA